ncbi:MAG TPA: Uma2 family endonuclease [Tepidisphaeraceae bacterium]|jgi:Uma2 family endonuclease|nr:Uma2 family endonuclease [Tepidisphaeraceae bacterium]
MVTSTTKMTARQYLELGEDPPGIRLELVNGEVAVSPRPSLDHSYAMLALGSILTEYVERQNLGQVLCDVDTVLGEFDVRAPDLLFVRKNKVRRLKKRAVDLAPDLCVEIISPTSIEIDREDKFKQYRDAGIPCYWIIDTDQRTFEGFELRKRKCTLVSSGHGSDEVSAPPFPDLTIPLARLWRPTK